MKRFKEFIKEKVSPIIITALPVHGRHAVKKRSKVESAEELKEEKQKSWLHTNDNAHIGKSLREVHRKMSVPNQDFHKLDYKEHLESYTHDSDGLNTYLIKKTSPLFDKKYDTQKHHEEFAKYLNKHLNVHKPLEHDLHVYHGTDQWNPGVEAAKHSEGHIHLPSFLSTTLKKKAAARYASSEHSGTLPGLGRHILHIHLKSGQRGAYIGDHGAYGNEHEFLLPSGTSLKIHPKPTKIVEGGSSVHVWHASVLPDAKPPKVSRKDINKHISDVMRGTNRRLQHQAISHPAITSDHIGIALQSNNDDLKRSAILHSKATKEHLTHVFKNEKPTLVTAALQNPNVDKDHISIGLNHHNVSVRELTLSHRLSYNHPNVTKEYLRNQIQTTNDYHLAKSVLKHPKADKDLIQDTAQTHPDNSIRRLAHQVLRGEKESDY